MSTGTKISWASHTWNPTLGCEKVSEGCSGCYAIRDAIRLGANPNPKIGPLFSGLAEMREGKPEWTGVPRTVTSRLTLPLSWHKPARIFVSSQSDLFHEDIPDTFIAQVFATMVLCPQHQFQVLTKRHARMRALLSDMQFVNQVLLASTELLKTNPPRWLLPEWQGWPLPNVWLGVSVEDQHWADIRIPALIKTSAAIRFLSCEPLLGPINLMRWTGTDIEGAVQLYGEAFSRSDGKPLINWCIVGGESGPNARPMNPNWVRSLRDQCRTSGIAFHFKQWGSWQYVGDMTDQGISFTVNGNGAGTLHGDSGFIKRKGAHDTPELDGEVIQEYPK